MKHVRYGDHWSYLYLYRQNETVPQVVLTMRNFCDRFCPGNALKKSCKQCSATISRLAIFLKHFKHILFNIRNKCLTSNVFQHKTVKHYV